MKKLIFSILLFLASLFCFADDSEEILSKIEKANHGATKMKFIEVKTTASKTQTTQEGELQFKPDNYLSMNYVNGDLFLIDGDMMTIKKNGQEKKFDTTKNVMMKGLSHVLLYAFLGTPSKIGPEQGADVSAQKDGDTYKVSITAKKKQARGYSCIIIRYSVKDCSIYDMQMDEMTGASTLYSIKK